MLSVEDELELELGWFDDDVPLEDWSLDEPDEEGVLEDEDDGLVLVEPAPALPLLMPELDGELDDEDDEPPLALSFFCRSIEVDEELEPDGLVLGDAPPAAEEDEEPGVVLGEAVVPLADEDEEPGVAVAPEGEVVEEELEERSAPRSHAVRSDAPSASETATAMVESLMWPPWLGYGYKGARIGPRLLRCHRAR